MASSKLRVVIAQPSRSEALHILAASKDATECQIEQLGGIDRRPSEA